MQPATILIDHAHFQYNTVMLGFVLASMSSILANRFLWGCVFLVTALAFKQMALYYAPIVFAYLIGVCLIPQPNPRRFLLIASITMLSFGAAFAPLLLGTLYDSSRGVAPTAGSRSTPLPPLLKLFPGLNKEKAWYYPIFLQLAQSIHRIFPFARGLFEDKVANLWCAFNVIHKLHVYPIPALSRISMLATFISILPACMTISLYPRRELLPWAMASSAWGFFLCSFQVHEKSVLLPLLPMTVLLGGEGGLGQEVEAWVGFANLLGVWTLFPLLKRDELRVPYAVLSLLWAYLMGLPPTSLSLYFGRRAGSNSLSVFIKIIHLAFYTAMIAWHAGEACIKPPPGKPDLWVVLNILIGAAGFSICFLWCNWQLLRRSGLMEEYFGIRRKIAAGGPKKKQ